MRSWQRISLLIVLYAGFVGFFPAAVRGAGGEDVQARLNTDIAAGRPIVVHVVVALCDNVNQGIVPVPKALGNGQDPRSNLYWGALYGLRTHLTRAGGWEIVANPGIADERILERSVFLSHVKRAGAHIPVYIVADAWDGAYIKPATARFLEMVAGIGPELVRVSCNGSTIDLHAGAQAHLIAYIGHNGLMDFSLPLPAVGISFDKPRSVMVLACASKSYFMDAVSGSRSQPLLLTTSLMAPEAYTVNAAIRAWVSDGSTIRVVEAAAQAYNQYQKCGIRAARKLFWGEP